MYDVFISYMHSDGSDIADSLTFALKSRGISVFHDKTEMMPGMDFSTKIRNAVYESRCFVLLLTPDLIRRVDSGWSYVSAEIRYAFDTAAERDKIIIPVVMRDTGLPSDGLFLEIRIRQCYCLDNDHKESVLSLADRIAQILWEHYADRLETEKLSEYLKQGDHHEAAKTLCSLISRDCGRMRNLSPSDESRRTVLFQNLISHLKKVVELYNYDYSSAGKELAHSKQDMLHKLWALQEFLDGSPADERRTLVNAAASIAFLYFEREIGLDCVDALTGGRSGCGKGTNFPMARFRELQKPYLDILNRYAEQDWISEDGRPLLDEADRRFVKSAFEYAYPSQDASAEDGLTPPGERADRSRNAVRQIASIFRTDTGEKVGELKESRGNINTVAYSPDGKQIATGASDGRITVWDAETLKAVVSLIYPSDIFSVSFSPDGTRLVSASGDGVLTVWSVITGKKWIEMETHHERIVSAVFSPNGKQIISFQDNDSAVIWDIQTGRQVAWLNDYRPESAAFSRHPEGNIIAAVVASDGVLGAETVFLRSVAALLREGNRLFDQICGKRSAEDFMRCLLLSYGRLKNYSEIVGEAKIVGECIERIADLNRKLEFASGGTISEAADGGIKALMGIRTPPEGVYDVFISHKSEDYDLAEKLYCYFQRNMKQAFLDRKSLPELSESEYRKSIMQALDKSTHFVVVLSDLSFMTSKWMSLEMTIFQSEIDEGRKSGSNFLMIVTNDVFDKIISSNKTVIPIEYRRCEIMRFTEYEKSIMSYIDKS